MPGRSSGSLAFWRGFRAAQCLCRGSEQPGDLLRLFCFVAVGAGVGQRWEGAAVGGRLGAEFAVCLGGHFVNLAGAMKRVFSSPESAEVGLLQGRLEEAKIRGLIRKEAASQAFPGATCQRELSVMA